MRLGILTGLVIVLLAALAPASFARAAPTSSFTLYGDASSGWGFTSSSLSIPGPTLVVPNGDNVSLRLFSLDGLVHRWYLDLNGNGVPDASEPTSSVFSSSSVPTWFNFTTAFAPGSYTYRCAIHPTSMHGTFILQPPGDGTPPVVVLGLSGPLGGGGWYRGAVTATLTAYDNDSGVRFLLYSVDGVTWHNYTGPLTFTEGAHTLEFYAVDNSGSVSPLRTVAVNVDAIPPALTIDSLPGTVTQSAVTVSWSAHDDGSGVARYEVRVDGGASQAVGTNTSFTATFADGSHTFHVTAFDVAGNAANETIDFRVDTNPFSPSGPYAGAPTYAIIGAALAVAGFVLWRRRTHSRPPTAPPPR